MRTAAIVSAVISTLSVQRLDAADLDSRALRPIISHLFATPSAFAGRLVAVYGLVIEAPSVDEFLLQDVSQRPLRIVVGAGRGAKPGEQLTVIGTVRTDARGPYIAASKVIPTRVTGGGGCC
jgi:hypothetical protein